MPHSTHSPHNAPYVITQPYEAADGNANGASCGDDPPGSWERRPECTRTPPVRMLRLIGNIALILSVTAVILGLGAMVYLDRGVYNPLDSLVLAAAMILFFWCPRALVIGIVLHLIALSIVLVRRSRHANARMHTTMDEGQLPYDAVTDHGADHGTSHGADASHQAHERDRPDNARKPLSIHGYADDGIQVSWHAATDGQVQVPATTPDSLRTSDRLPEDGRWRKNGP